MKKVNVNPDEILDLLHALAEVINQRQPKPPVLVAALEMMIVAALASAKVTYDLDLVEDIIASIQQNTQTTIDTASATFRPRYRAPRAPGQGH